MPSSASACRCAVGTCSWSKVTTCAPLVTFRSISRSVWSPTMLSAITCAADTPSASASSRSGIPIAAAGSGHHPGELAAADDGDNWRELRHE